MSESVVKQAISSHPLTRQDEAGVVCVIDDDEDVCKALERLIRSIGLAVETFASPQAFLAYSLADRPSCLVLDVHLPGQNGLDLQAALEQAEPKIPIVFVTGHGDVATSVRAMKAGAVDFLEKPFEDRDLLDAIHRALDESRERRADRAERAVIRQRIASLTPRERQVLELLVTGMLNKQVADELGAAEKTIKVHRGRIIAKMHANSVVDLVLMTEKIGNRRSRGSGA